jgi:hypothetical protein
MQESSTSNDSNDPNEGDRKKIKLSLKPSNKTDPQPAEEKENENTPQKNQPLPKPKLSLSLKSDKNEPPKEVLKEKDSPKPRTPLVENEPASSKGEDSESHSMPGTQRIEFSKKATPPPKPSNEAEKTEATAPMAPKSLADRLKEETASFSEKKEEPASFETPKAKLNLSEDNKKDLIPPRPIKKETVPPFPFSPKPKSETGIPSMPPKKETEPEHKSEEGLKKAPVPAPPPKAIKEKTRSSLRSKTSVKQKDEKTPSHLPKIFLVLIILFASLCYFLYSSFVSESVDDTNLTENTSSQVEDAGEESIASEQENSTPPFARETESTTDQSPSNQNFLASSADTNPQIAAFIDSLEINVVKVSGDNQGVFINRIFYKTGEEINNELGIIFVGFETARNELVFSDFNGAFYYRYY